MLSTLTYRWANLQVNEFFYVLWGAFLLFLTAQISVPLEPVPITLQTFGIMLVGLTFERKIAIKSVMSYLAMGAVGIPVFANFSGGYQIFLGATGGYLLGFLVAITLMTSIRKYLKSENFFYVCLSGTVGTVVIYVFGIIGLMRFMDFNQAIQVGLLPFILPGIVKILLLASTIKYLKPGHKFE